MKKARWMLLITQFGISIYIGYNEVRRTREAARREQDRKALLKGGTSDVLGQDITFTQKNPEGLPPRAPGSRLSGGMRTSWR